MEENKYEELVELIQKWVSEKDLVNNLSKSPSNSKNQLIIAKRLASMEPDFLKYSTLKQLKKINPVVVQIIRQTFYEIYFSRKENTGLIGKNVKIDEVEGTIDISLEDCLLNKKEMKAKFGEHVANYLRQCEMRPYGCVRLADQAVNRFYREMQKDALTSISDIRKKKGEKGNQVKEHRLLATYKDIERSIKPLNNAIKNKSKYNSEEIKSINIIKESLEKTQVLCKSLYNKIKK